MELVCSLLAALSLALYTADPLRAQQSTDSNDNYVALEEVIVTAQKRAESLQDVPISAQVVGFEKLANQNLTSVVALAEEFPSVRVTTSGRSSLYYIRGTGSGDSQSFDQSVGTFVDNIYHGRSRTSAATFLDLDHVEILKGPQSTFFGNNAIAGAFNIVTRKPEKEFGGWARGLIGPGGNNGQYYAVEGAVNVPLDETLSLRVAGTLNGQDGYLKNINTGKRAPNEDNYGLRGMLLYEPNDDFEVLLKTEFGQSKNHGGFILRQTSCPPPAPFPTGAFCGVNLAAGAPTSLDTKKFVANDGNEIVLRNHATVLSVNYQLNEHTLTSTTGYNKYSYNLNLDLDGTAIDFLNVQAPERYWQLSQEFRIASPLGQTFEYLAGVYYQHSRLTIAQSVNFFFLTGPFSGIPPLAPFLPLGQKVNAWQKEDIYSAFGSLSWNVNEKLKLTAGLRGSIAQKDFDWQLIYGTATAQYGGIVRFPATAEAVASSLGLGTVGSVNLDRTDKALMPSAQIQYQLNDDMMAYFSYSRGFKAGGFSVADVTADPANYPFEPENVDAYEIGLKSEFFDNKVKLNVALFRNDFSDLQVTIQGTNASGGLINIVRNAAESRSQGLEAELEWLMTPHFKLSGSTTFLDAEYRRYPNAAPTLIQKFNGATTQDLSGRPTLFAPEWSGNVSGTYTVPVFHGFMLTAQATGIFSSEYYTLSTIDPISIQDSYARLDARLSLDSPDGKWGLDIIGKNLTDEVVVNFTGLQPTSDGSLFQGQEPVRHVMFQARYEF